MDDFYRILISGAFAGFVTDFALFPIDTIKSRLQSPGGLAKSGGFKNLYKGLTPVVICSVPNAAVYFSAYEHTKKLHIFKHSTFNQMLGGMFAEIASCCFKIPFEVVKINSQTSGASDIKVIRRILASSGSLGLYRGFFSTVAREIPFSIIQMPIWEQLKAFHRERSSQKMTAMHSALYGSLGGAIAALATNPLDVVKTRIMLMSKKQSIRQTFKAVYQENGLKSLFAGALPRVTWIAIGGALFFGAYEQALIFLQ